MFIFGVDATWYLWLLITGIYIGPIAGHQHPTWLHHLPRSFLFFPINALFFLPRCALSDGQISPKKQTKQLFVWQLLPNDYIQSILLAPGNAKSNVKMQKKKKKSNEKSWWSLPYIPGTYQIIIQTGQALWSLETILPWPFTLAGSPKHIPSASSYTQVCPRRDWWPIFNCLQLIINTYRT